MTKNRQMKMGGLNRLEIFTIFVIFLTFSINECWSQALSQKVAIYSDKNCEGSVKVYIQSDEPRLPTFLNDQAFSAQVNGVWLFYEHENYNEAQEGLIEYSFFTGSCLNFRNLGGKLTSFRFAGSPRDHTISSLTLYKGIHFQGQDEFTTVDSPNLSLDKIASSYIITGSDPWTLYDSPNFEGNPICVKPTNSQPSFIPNAKTFGTPNQIFLIRSVKKGCFLNPILRV